MAVTACCISHTISPPRWRKRCTTANGSSPYQVLMLLPNGDLLAATPGAYPAPPRWWALPPGAQAWAADPAITAPTLLGRFLVAGDGLYGLQVAAGGPQGLRYTSLLRLPMPSASAPRPRVQAPAR